MSRDRPIDIACKLVQEREKAIAIADGTMEQRADGERLKWFWLPRSQITIERDEGDDIVVTMPEWLALEKGLI